MTLVLNTKNNSFLISNTGLQIFNLSLSTFLIIIWYLPAQNFAGSKSQWNPNDINAYYANLDIKSPKEMMTDHLDNKNT